MTKNELIELLLPGILQSGQSEAQAREMLERSTTSELGLMKDKQVRAGIYRPAQAQPTPSATWQDVAAARAQHEEEVFEIRLRGQAERVADHELFKLKKREWEEPRRKAEQERRLRIARETFPTVCRAHNLSECEANFRLLLDSDLLDSEYTATQAITSNAITGLAPASPDEAEKFQQERIDAHNAALLALPTDRLKEAARQEQHERRAQAAQEAETKLLEDLAQRDSYRGFPELPRQMADGTVLDSMFFKKLPTDRLKYYIKRFGPSQISQRINNR